MGKQRLQIYIKKGDETMNNNSKLIARIYPLDEETEQLITEKSEIIQIFFDPNRKIIHDQFDNELLDSECVADEFPDGINLSDHKTFESILTELCFLDCSSLACLEYVNVPEWNLKFPIQWLF